jgi:Putative Flp pilus-assembly TadE/G-like
VLVAITIVTLLAMVALAIDVVTLYVAKGEVQRAADAAALVAARAFAGSGVTSDPNNASLQTLAENLANAGIAGILKKPRWVPHGSRCGQKRLINQIRRVPTLAAERPTTHY